MINQDKMYIYMISDAMAHYTMSDISFEKNIKVINKDVLFKNRVINYISKIYLSLKINSIVDLPFKKFWYKKLLNPYKNKEMIFIISPSWYNKQLISYLRKRYLNCKIILFFHDIVAKDLKHNKQLDIIEARKQVDKIIVYNKEDAEKYNVIYHPAGYSPLAGSQLAEFPHTDVVFIGAAKNRLVDIRKAYKLFTDNNLTCFFYVTEVSEEERCCDGIIYGDKFLPYKIDYKMAALSFCRRCFRMIIVQDFMNDNNTQTISVKQKRFKEALSKEPFNTAFTKEAMLSNPDKDFLESILIAKGRYNMLALYWKLRSIVRMIKN